MAQRPVREYLLEKIGKVVKLEHPEIEKRGDYSFYTTDKDVMIKEDEVIEKVERVGGFVNIWLKNDVLVNQIDEVIRRGQQYGGSTGGSGKRVIIDYSAPNIAKPFGIGHLRSTIIGQALYNLYKFCGWDVVGDNHLGDWGTQFGKLIFMIKNTDTADYSIDNLEKLYVEFHKHAEWEDEGRKWFKKLEEGDAEAKEIWEKCVKVSMAEFDRIYELLGVKIDAAFGESFYEDMMIGVIEEAKRKGVMHESEGAGVIEIPGIKTPLMLLKSDGGTTYATRDLATLKFRREKWDPDMVIYEVGAEQGLHFEQVFAAANMLGYIKEGERLVHTKHGLYLDMDGKKFATRKGKTIKLEEVLEEAIERARKLGNTDQAQAVGIGAIKYFDLMHSVQSNIVFDWEKMMNLQGNSGPYLQYTHARIESVIRQGGKLMERYNLSNYRVNKEEERVVKMIYRFGEVVEESASRLAPNLLCGYLFELAQRFNTFYNKHSILTPTGAAEEERGRTREFRLAMTKATGIIIRNGLTLLGIEAPGRM
ncbi:arginine--tRNA ligase [Candidatus Amesbacteria bacterium RIFCSPLOWO2_01_FULL_49_25]|uniref:Arginine--tRNA ligase n=1 Tax=Candidatus Amesbacteria bacterium RIFCSPHIGHO2_01_FULL_48_32b TaxID=1797253 RepID=A0A1F4YEL1_9BACT|nr:MAG: arginine--tRNA ligase [Candidatus Amesbacteria bacterium RIFCSPHIGHO2_01_FULL_48_32b]OGD06904.1 MAG: arginine--tRNA ligase [Candidatus Amesbacteria bacterium RIFCSPLOWO2_01_FULL_49_25]